MPVFEPTGRKAKDLWLVDGSPDFAHFPGGLADHIPEPLPIWLRVGTSAYGEVHIRGGHGHWVRRFNKTVPELLYEKLGQPGVIYTAEETAKFKISLRLNPTSLLILHLITHQQQPHFSVTSFYTHPARLDGERLGRYPGRPGSAQTRRMF